MLPNDLARSLCSFDGCGCPGEEMTQGGYYTYTYNRPARRIANAGPVDVTAGRLQVEMRSAYDEAEQRITLVCKLREKPWELSYHDIALLTTDELQVEFDRLPYYAARRTVGLKNEGSDNGLALPLLKWLREYRLLTGLVPADGPQGKRWRVQRGNVSTLSGETYSGDTVTDALVKFFWDEQRGEFERKYPHLREDNDDDSD